MMKSYRYLGVLIYSSVLVFIVGSALGKGVLSLCQARIGRIDALPAPWYVEDISHRLTRRLSVVAMYYYEKSVSKPSQTFLALILHCYAGSRGNCEEWISNPVRY